MKRPQLWIPLFSGVIALFVLSCGKTPKPEAASPAARNLSSDPAAPASAAPDLAPAPPDPSLQPPAPNPFGSEQARSSFETRILSGDMSGFEDYAGTIEEWAASVPEGGEIDAALARLEAAARESAAPPHVSFALAALYGRKGLIPKQYAALTQAVEAAAARPDLVFALTAVHGRKETLKSRYKADELLVGSLAVESEPPGARIHVDGKEIGTSPLRIDKIREGTYVVRFTMKGYEDWELPASIQTGRETRVRAPLGAKPGRILVSIEPEVMVSLDGSPPERAPFAFENLAPGEHILSFASSSLLSGRRYYVTPADSTILVQPGESVEYKRILAVARSRFRTLNAPAGSLLYIDGKKPDRGGPDDWHELDSGAYALSIETPGGIRFSQDVHILPGVSPEFDIRSMIVRIPARTIALDGKADSWGPLEPLYESTGSSFLGDPAYGIRRFFVCRDEKYLYWRVDFNNNNPLAKTPAGVKEKLFTMIILDFKSRKAHIGLSLDKNIETRELLAGCNVYDNEKQKKEKTLGSATSLSYKLSDTMYVGRVALSLIEEYLKDVYTVRFALANQVSGRWTAEESTKRFQIDFTR